jgi:hypothetical protein
VAEVGVDATLVPTGPGPTATFFLGYPLSTNHQQLLNTLEADWSVEGQGVPETWSGALQTTTTGFLPPFYVQNFTPYLYGTVDVHMHEKMEVNLSRVRVNRTILEQITWASLQASLANRPDVTIDLGADKVNNPNDPTIKTFVTNTLGTSYQTTMSPYSAARQLFIAVANALTYQRGTAQLPTPSTAVAALAAGWGDCGDYGMLLTTVLRSIGIPARINYGHWPTGGGTHVINEFWMPGAEWIPADATFSSMLFPKSGYPYFLGNVPALDIWVAFGFGNHYAGGGLDETWVEGPGTGNVTNENITSWVVTQTNVPPAQ